MSARLYQYGYNSFGCCKEPIVQLCKKKENNIEGRGSGYLPGSEIWHWHCRGNLDILFGSGMTIKGPESSPDNRTSTGLYDHPTPSKHNRPWSLSTSQRGYGQHKGAGPLRHLRLLLRFKCFKINISTRRNPVLTTGVLVLNYEEPDCLFVYI